MKKFLLVLFFLLSNGSWIKPQISDDDDTNSSLGYVDDNEVAYALGQTNQNIKNLKEHIHDLYINYRHLRLVSNLILESVRRQEKRVKAALKMYVEYEISESALIDELEDVNLQFHAIIDLLIVLREDSENSNDND